jgi:hypothetical protein
MKRASIAAVGFFAVFFVPMMAEAQKTETNCHKDDITGDVPCTTGPAQPKTVGEAIAKALAPKSASSPSIQQVQTGPPQISPEAVKELLAGMKKERDEKDTINFLLCRQNPKSNVTDYDGQAKSCDETIEYTKAFCAVNTAAERCNLARTKEEVQKAFAALVDEYNTNEHRHKAWEQSYFSEKFAKLTRWGCMSFPDMTLPQMDAGQHSCPNAPGR